MKRGSARALVCAALLASACGAPVSDENVDFVPVPPEAAATLRRAALRLVTGSSAAPVIFVNFDGASVVKGNSFNQSFIPCVAVATIPAYAADAATRAAIVAGVQAHYDDVQAAVRVTSSRPASGLYTTIQVGGSYAGSLGCSGTPYGIAPLPTTGSVGWMGFVFARPGDPTTVVAQAIAHEAGHTFSLQHMAAGNDVMYPVVTPNPSAFMAGAIYGSATIQDSPAILRQVLGTAGATPTPTPACVGDRIANGASLAQTQVLCSSDGRYHAMLQPDGNFVITVAATGEAIWNTRTAGGTRLVMQGDCNLVLYSPSQALWWTGTNGRGTACHAVMQTDGNFVVYRDADGRPLWSIWTGRL